jgi:hypothetical protein
MYQMTTDDARKRLTEIERELLDLLQQFENDTGLTIVNVDLIHAERRLGELPRSQRRVQELVIRAALI